MPYDTLTELTSTALLAELPSSGGYFNPIKIVFFLLALILWAYNASWVKKDTKKIHVPPDMWIMLAYASGAACLVAWLLLPLYWAGFLIYALGYGTVMLIYVIFRNKRVSPAQTVLTLAHLSRLMAGGKGSKLSLEASSAKDKTRIRNFEDKIQPWPTDSVEHQAFGALQNLLFDAIWRRTSDIRLDFAPDQPIKVIYKVDGVERACEPIEAELAPHLLIQIKRISGMDPAEQRRPQNGKFNATIGAEGGEKSVDIESRASGSTAGQRIIMRMIADELKFRPPDLGLNKDQFPLFEKLIKQPKGVIIVSGPRGSGISSTLYAILRSHDAFMQNIHTLEVSKSMTLENITQNIYDGTDPTVTFGNRFRSLIRTEPDVAMAGDTPDNETMAYAAAAGRQQKKLYLAMTASDSFVALRRYLHAVGDNALAASSLVAVTNQRLVRVLCNSCRKAYKPDPILLKKGNLPTGESRPFYRPPNPDEIEVDKHGNQLLCAVCQGSGYYGRSGVFEILLIDEQLRGLIAKGADILTLKAEARKKGMLYLQEVALRKVFDGVTSIAEVLRVTKEEQPATAKSR